MASKQFKVPINLVNLASNPGTASEGDIYYNTTSDVVSVYANAAWAGLAPLASPTFTGSVSVATDIGSSGAYLQITNNTQTTIKSLTNSAVVRQDTGITLNTGGSGAVKTWVLKNNGDLTFPDGTNQTTSFLGISSYSTTNISEGTNLYYTDERAQDAIGTILGSGLSYNDFTGAISNSGVLNLTGTVNQIVLNNSTGSITISIPNSPVFVTPNIGIATATSVNQTTIPSSKTLVVTTDIGSSVQAYNANLSSIAVLSGTSGFLKKVAENTWSLDTSTYLTSAVTNIQGTANQITASSNTGSVTLSLPSAVTMPGSLTVTGNLIVNGITQTVNSTTVTVDDPVITLGGDTAPVSDDNKDRGVEFRWHDGASAKVGFFGYKDSDRVFTFIQDATNSGEVFSGTPGTIRASSIDYNNGTETTALTQTFSSSGTVSSLSDTAFNSLTYAVAEYTIYVKNASGKYTSKVMLVCNGTSSVNITEYAILTVGTVPTVTVSASNTTNSVLLTVSSASATQIRIIRTLVAI